jgi:hypothetical protein
MRTFEKVLTVIALSGMCLAAPNPPDGQPAAKKSAKHHAAKPVQKDETAEQIRELKEMMAQQNAAMQAQIQQLQQQLQQTQQNLQQTQQQLTQTQQTAQQADAKVAAVETNTSMQVQKVQADLSGVKTAVTKNEKDVGELQHPNTVAYKGIRITPGGFLDLAGIYRTHATNSGPATIFNGIPLETATTGVGGLSEFSMSARSSRITLRADTEAGSTKIAGYFEMDFQGLGVATPNQTTGFPMRIRQAWGRARFGDGWSVTGGQMWNLVTMNRRAGDADATWIPNTIDANYLVGYDWGRQAEFRVAKSLNKNFTLAVALTDPSYLNLGVTNTNGQVAGLASAGAGNLGNTLTAGCTSASTSATLPVSVTTLCPQIDTYSTNLAPDVIVKLAYDDPKLGHYEVKGLGRFFRDRLPGKWDNTGIGGGIGGGAIVPVISRKVDFIAQGMYGKGISRYQDSGQYDFVVRTNSLSSTNVATTTGGDNNLTNIKTFSTVFGFETHPNSKAEFDVYYGDEYYGRTTYKVTSIATGLPVVLGYGSTNGGNNRNLLEGSGVFWYDVYKGSLGTLRYGAQYAYALRTTWSVGGEKAPKGIDNIGFLGMRYILP